MNARTASIVGGVGRFLIGLGLVVILFAGFQLYGTGLLEAQAQGELDNEFDDRISALEDAGLVVSEETSDGEAEPPPPPTDSEAINAAIDEAFAPEFGERDGPDFVVAPIDPEALSEEEIALLTPRTGDVLGRIEIPDIGLERNIVEGTRRNDLRKGPGHYADTPLPGQPGNSAIAGHRTTYGEPFRNLHQLEPGDLIKVTTFQGEHYYQVMGHTNEDGEEVGHFIVDPTEIEVIEDAGDNRLTLTACHPIASSRQRIIVTAQLVSAPTPVLPAISETRLAELAGEDIDEGDDPADEVASDEPESEDDTEENALEESLGWNWEERTPTLLWAMATLAVVALAVAAARRWRRWIVYAGAAPVFAFTLFFCFVHLDRMLPAL